MRSLRAAPSRFPALAEYAKESFPAKQPILEGALDLTARIHKDFSYDPRATTVQTPIRDVFDDRRGVCQDFAHLQLGCFRALGLSRPLCKRISAYTSACRQAKARRRRRIARLG